MNPAVSTQRRRHMSQNKNLTIGPGDWVEILGDDELLFVLAVYNDDLVFGLLNQTGSGPKAEVAVNCTVPHQLCRPLPHHEVDAINKLPETKRFYRHLRFANDQSPLELQVNIIRNKLKIELPCFEIIEHLAGETPWRMDRDDILECFYCGNIRHNLETDDEANHDPGCLFLTMKDSVKENS